MDSFLPIAPSLSCVASREYPQHPRCCATHLSPTHYQQPSKMISRQGNRKIPAQLRIDISLLIITNYIYRPLVLKACIIDLEYWKIQSSNQFLPLTLHNIMMIKAQLKLYHCLLVSSMFRNAYKIRLELHQIIRSKL